MLLPAAGRFAKSNSLDLPAGRLVQDHRKGAALKHTHNQHILHYKEFQN